MDIVRVFVVSAHGFDRLTSSARAVFEGFWLGVLSHEALARIDEIYYDNSAEYVDDGYNRQGLWSWEDQALARHFTPSSRIVVTAAGGGREVLALLDRGFDATGFEPHPLLAEFGSGLTASAGHGSRIRPSARSEWPAEAAGVDGAIVGWGAYMLIPGRRRRVAFLRSAAAALPPGAPVLLSFFPRTGLRSRWRISTAVANVLRGLRRAEPAQIGDALVPNFVHHFTRSEVEAELSEAGLDMVDFGSTDYGWAVGRVRDVERGATA